MSELRRLADRERWPALAAALGPWVTAQRWFGGKARTVATATVADTALLGDDAVLLVLLDLTYTAGLADRYQVPLALDGPTVVEVDGVALCDAAHSPAGRRALAEANLGEGAVGTTAGATLRGLPIGPPTAADLGRSRVMDVEQSNTSVVYDDALILKAFRRLEPGLNPDVELTRALTEAGFAHVPAQHGALRLDPADGGAPTYLGVVSTFLTGAVEGWDLATRVARTVLDGGADSMAASIAELGDVVGRMHVALRDTLGAEEASLDDADAWSRSMQQQARQVLALAAERAPDAAAPLLDREAEILDRLTGLADLGDLGLLVRTHGDLHLGQVLTHPEHGWQVLDFEGEPARPLEARRERHSPLRDVAGVLRSFDYAAASAALDLPPRLADWRDDLRRAFLDGYHDAAGRAGLVPETTWTALLAAFELDKALYELGYELANRPDWVAIPVAGIMRVLARSPRPTETPTR
jgi:maltokinase